MSVSVEVGVALNEWGFADLIPHFTKHEISYDMFLELTLEDLKSFLPYGKVLKFHPIYEREIVALRNKKQVPLADKLDENLNEVSSNQKASTSKEPPARPPVNPPANEPSTSQQGASEANLHCLFSDEEEANPEELVSEVKKLFDSIFQGQVLLATSSDDLTNEDRDRIAEVVVCCELRKSSTKQIDSARLLQLAKAVAAVFPGESYITYYTPHKKLDGKIFQARGKFCTQLYSWRKRGIDVGLVNKIHSFKKPKTRSTCDVPDDAVDAVNWLRVNLGPVETASEYWKSSFQYRQQLLDGSSIEEYLNTFPILRQQEGLQLLLQDYAQDDKLKETANNFSLHWPEFAQRMLAKLTPKLLAANELNTLQSLLQKDSGVHVCHHFLLHLSKLFPTPVVVKGARPNHWTPNKSEIQFGFLGHFHSEEEFRTFIHDKATRLSSFKKPLNFQPFAAIVGPNVRNVQKCFVVLQANDIYEVDTPFAAVDCTFKVIQVLNADYPPESKLVWLVVQQALYKLFTDSDKKILSPQLVPILKHFTKK